MIKHIEAVTKQFKTDFVEFIEASIAFASMQEPIQSISADDEIDWATNYLDNALTTLNNKLHEESAKAAEGMKKKVIANMLLDEPLYLERGMDGVQGYNKALQDTADWHREQIISDKN